MQIALLRQKLVLHSPERSCSFRLVPVIYWSYGIQNIGVTQEFLVWGYSLIQHVQTPCFQSLAGRWGIGIWSQGTIGRWFTLLIGWSSVKAKNYWSNAFHGAEKPEKAILLTCGRIRLDCFIMLATTASQLYPTLPPLTKRRRIEKCSARLSPFNFPTS